MVGSASVQARVTYLALPGCPVLLTQENRGIINILHIRNTQLSRKKKVPDCFLKKGVSLNKRRGQQIGILQY